MMMPPLTVVKGDYFTAWAPAGIIRRLEVHDRPSHGKALHHVMWKNPRHSSGWQAHQGLLRETLDAGGRITVEYFEERGEEQLLCPESTQGDNDDHILRHTS